MDVANLILDYIQALIWPALVLVVMLLFRVPLAERIEEHPPPEVPWT